MAYRAKPTNSLFVYTKTIITLSFYFKPKLLYIMFYFYRQSSFLEDLFFPNRKDNVKRVVVLSALTGVASAAIASFFAKEENRVHTRQTLDRLSDEIRVVKDRITDKAHDVANDIGDNVRRKARQIDGKIPNVDVKYDNSNSE
jgi:hypothetical protein